MVARFIGGEYSARLLPRMPGGGATCKSCLKRVEIEKKEKSSN